MHTAMVMIMVRTITATNAGHLIAWDHDSPIITTTTPTTIITTTITPMLITTK